MDNLKAFHHQRVKALLRKSTASTTATIASHDDYAAVHKVLQVPELFHLILGFTSPRSWPTLCLVSKAFAETLKPLIWRDVSCTTHAMTEKMLPFLHKFAYMIQALDLSWLPHSSLSDLIQELSRAKYLRLVSLILHGAELTAGQLAYLLELSPQLRSIDITGCQFDLHPLNILSQSSYLESIAFDQDHSLLPAWPHPSSVFYSWPNLNRLHISQRAQSTAQSVQLLQKSIQDSSLNLKALELHSAHGWKESTLEKIIRDSHTLSTLCFKGCDFTGYGLTSVASSLRCLRSLQVHNCPNILAQDCLYVVKACPRIRELDLEGFSISVDIFEQIARAAPQLTSFSIDNCEFSIKSLGYILVYCHELLRLRVGTLLTPRALNILFGGQPWSCHKLEELIFGDIQWSSTELERDRLGNQALKTMWRVLASLRRLRVLALKWHGSKYHIHRGAGLRELGVLFYLEKLTFTGLGAWEYNDVLWIVEAFPRLEEFVYADREMSTPLWAWLRRNQPDLRLIPTT